MAERRRPDALSAHLHAFAAALATNAPVSASIVAGLAEEVSAGGAVADLLLRAGADRPLAGIRLVAGLHHLVLTGRAPALADRLAADLRRAGRGEEVGAGSSIWPVARKALLAHPREIAEALERPVQQHQPGRAAALVEGLGAVGAGRVRLLEIGACAGLSLIVDSYRWTGAGWEWGCPDSPVTLPATGPSPPRVDIVERAGCDLAPRDPASLRDRLILLSFLPPERPAAVQRTQAALALAAARAVAVDRAAAGEWLPRRLAGTGGEDVTTVVWHSLTWHYLAGTEQQAVEAALAEAGRRGPTVRICYEPAAWGQVPRLAVRWYPR